MAVEKRVEREGAEGAAGLGEQLGTVQTSLIQTWFQRACDGGGSCRGIRRRTLDTASRSGTTRKLRTCSRISAGRSSMVVVLCPGLGDSSPAHPLSPPGETFPSASSGTILAIQVRERVRVATLLAAEERRAAIDALVRRRSCVHACAEKNAAGVFIVEGSEVEAERPGSSSSGAAAAGASSALRVCRLPADAPTTSGSKGRGTGGRWGALSHLSLYLLSDVYIAVTRASSTAMTSPLVSRQACRVHCSPSTVYVYNPCVQCLCLPPPSAAPHPPSSASAHSPPCSQLSPRNLAHAGRARLALVTSMSVLMSATSASRLP